MAHLALSALLASLTLTALLPLAAAATPDPTPDSNAAVVRLRTNCGSSPDNENCFESVAALTTTGTTGWIWQTRQPSASAPLLVDVGPGVFTDPFRCDGTGTNRGYVTLRGSGREQSIISGSNFGASLRNCKNLSFIDIGVHGARTAVAWTGSEGGSSSWSNVDMVARGTVTTGAIIAWLDSDCGTQTTRSVHFFHGSRIRSLAVQSGPSQYQAFRSHCAESWIFGGELALELGAGAANDATVVYNGGGLVEVFGTALRARATGSFDTEDVVGILAYDDGAQSLPIAVHSHGANVGLNTASASATDIDVIAILAMDDVTVHSPGTAYALSPGTSASATRVSITSGTPNVEAPFHWSADTLPPAVASKTGEDLFVETDCSSTSCSGGTQPHLMIYTTSCSPSPWWDVARNACRQ